MKSGILLFYGLALALVMIVVRTLEIRFMYFNLRSEIFIFSISIVFMGLGIFLSRRFKGKEQQQIVIVNVPVAEEFTANQSEIDRIGLSKREMEVLRLISEGLSNEEIGDKLSLAVPTIKSHISRLFEKLEVNRRTMAIEKARRLRIIP